MPRLFTGIEIPPDVAMRLASYRGGLAGARWIEPSDYHVTLRFLGDVDNATASDVHDLLETLRPRGPIAVGLTALGCFGGDKPRAVYAAVRPDTELQELHGEHERVARQAGLEPEGRKFTPHVTLARLRRVSPGAVAYYLTETGVFTPVSFTAAHAALFSARDSRGGGPYVVEARYPLT